jgi:hypothetical protein
MSDSSPEPAKPQFGIGSIVNHTIYGKGRVAGYEDGTYVVVFKGGEVKRVGFGFHGLTCAERAGDPETDRIKQAVREVLGDHGWLDVDAEIAKRWAGGTLVLVPGKTDTQSKEVPIEALFKKIIGIRDKLRVLEQKINAHPTLSLEDKLEIEGYITRCYGSLTSFNILFAAKESQFKGTGQEK